MEGNCPGQKHRDMMKSEDRRKIQEGKIVSYVGKYVA